MFLFFTATFDIAKPCLPSLQVLEGTEEVSLGCHLQGSRGVLYRTDMVMIVRFQQLTTLVLSRYDFTLSCDFDILV